MSTADADTAVSCAVQRLLASRHARLLLDGPQRRASAGSDLAEEIRRRQGVGRGRRLASLAGKAALLWALAHVCSALLFGQYPALWQLLQNTEAFSRTELEYNHLVRRASVGLGLHNSELLHARERQQCLVPNPLHRPRLRCCPCDRHRVVAAGSAASLRAGFGYLFNRMVGPFAYANNSQSGLTLPQLRRAILANWEAVVARGSNRLRVLWPPASVDEPVSLERLFPADSTSTTLLDGRAIAWLFGHWPAIRALRGLLRRPDHVPELAEDVLARQLLFLGEGLPAGEAIHLGDLGVVKGLAYAYALHGEVAVSLALKPECCPSEVARPGYRNQTRRLGPGDVIGFVTDCYWVSAAKLATPGYAVVYFGAVYNGLHPIDVKPAARK